MENNIFNRLLLNKDKNDKAFIPIARNYIFIVNKFSHAFVFTIKYKEYGFFGDKLKTLEQQNFKIVPKILKAKVD